MKSIVKIISFIAIIISFLVFFTTYLLAVDDISENPVKTENFVTLKMVTFKQITICEDPGCEIVTEIPDVSVIQASGMIVKSVDDKSYILTADHFCEEFIDESVSFSPTRVTFKSILSVYEISGRESSAEIVHRNPEFDLCLVEIDKVDVSDIRIARSMPDYGEYIYTVSSPMGFSGDNYAIHLDGQFSGCYSIIDCYFSIPARPGSSGSIVTNKKGEIIGMIQRAAPAVPFISIGSNNESIWMFMDDASKEIGISLL